MVREFRYAQLPLVVYLLPLRILVAHQAVSKQESVREQHQLAVAKQQLMVAFANKRSLNVDWFVIST